jgi:peptidoglycan/LPS O-acetylase OafA/YrhL
MVTLEKEKKTSSLATPVKTRRFDIDWLRVGVVFLLFPYHSARVFDTLDPFYVKNAQLSDPLTWFILFATPWSMPLLFFLAGASSWYALGFRSGGRYAKERFLRLLIPLILGVLIIVPPQAYFARLTRLTYSGNFFEFYPNYLQSINFDKSDYDGSVFTLAHLWFIFFLFLFSLVALPLFLYLKSEKGQQFIASWAGVLAGPGLLFGIPLLLGAAVLAPNLIGHPALVYFLIFVAGFIFQAHEKLTESINCLSIWTLPLGLGAGFVCFLFFDYRLDQEMSAGKAGFWVAFTFASWFLMVAILSLGHRYLNFGNALLKYLSEAAYPVYILHQTIIIMVAYYVVQWNTGVLPKYLALLTLSVAITLGLYELLIKPFNWIRFVFGLKPRGKS